MSNRENSNDAALGDLLRAAYDETEATLSAGRRRAVLDAAMQPRRRFFAPILPIRKGWVLAAAAAAIAVIVAPLAFHPGSSPTPSQLAPASASTAVEGLQVTSEGGKVVLRWQDQGRPIRVIRATTPDPSAPGSEAIIDGDSWTDPQPNGAQVVFYRVEAVEG